LELHNKYALWLMEDEKQQIVDAIAVTNKLCLITW